MHTHDRRDRDSAQYIRDLFAATRDGRLAITYFPDNGEQPYTLTYAMNWTAADAEAIAARHRALVTMLARMAPLYDELLDADNRARLLTDEERAAWEIYVRPFEPFEVSFAEIDELYRRAEFDELDEEENALLERYVDWKTAACLRRLPARGCNPTNLIVRGARYTALVRWHAPPSVLHEEARLLAEEMVLYEGGKKEETV